MALRTIVKEGDPALTKVCRPVTEFNDRLHTLLDDMTETLIEANGLGLAAPQVGVLRRVVLVEAEPGQLYELINPEIVETRGEQCEVEGCLSLPHQWGTVKRPAWVKVKTASCTMTASRSTPSGMPRTMKRSMM